MGYPTDTFAMKPLHLSLGENHGRRGGTNITAKSTGSMLSRCLLYLLLHVIHMYICTYVYNILRFFFLAFLVYTYAQTHHSGLNKLSQGLSVEESDSPSLHLVSRRIAIALHLGTMQDFSCLLQHVNWWWHYTGLVQAATVESSWVHRLSLSNNQTFSSNSMEWEANVWVECQ